MGRGSGERDLKTPELWPVQQKKEDFLELSFLGEEAVLLQALLIAASDVFNRHHRLSVWEVRMTAAIFLVGVDILKDVIEIFLAVVDIPQKLIVKSEDPTTRALCVLH